MNIISGFATHGRSEEINDAVRALGLFVNVCPILLEEPDKKTPEMLVKEVVKSKGNLFPFRNYPLDEIIKLSKNKILFDTLFNYVDFHNLNELSELNNLKIQQGPCVEETNYTLVTQISKNQISKRLEVRFVFQEKAVEIDVFAKLFIGVAHDFTRGVPIADSLRVYSART